MKKLIVFVCNGNIHRSVVAEICLKQELKKRRLDNKFIVISMGLQGSAGTNFPKYKNLSEYPKEWKIQKPILEELGIDISEHSSKPIDRKIVEKASLILAMDRKVLIDLPNSLTKQFPEHRDKIKLFMELERKMEDVPDCFGSSDVKLHHYVDEKIVKTLKKKIGLIVDFK